MVSERAPAPVDYEDDDGYNYDDDGDDYVDNAATEVAIAAERPDASIIIRGEDFEMPAVQLQVEPLQGAIHSDEFLEGGCSYRYESGGSDGTGY